MLAPRSPMLRLRFTSGATQSRPAGPRRPHTSPSVCSACMRLSYLSVRAGARAPVVPAGSPGGAGGAAGGSET